jgi:hypothetical protein
MSRLLKRIVKHVGALVVLSFCSFSYSNAQTVETTPNLIGGTWNNVVTGTHPANCCTGGPQPLFDPTTNTIHFSYGLTAVHQVIGINTALSGTGIQINGWNWGYDLRNQNGWAGGQGGTDTISATSFMTNNLGQIIKQSDQHYSTQFDWTRFTGTEYLTSPLSLANSGSLGIQFVSKDSGFWAGYYGPQVRNVSLTANYTVDPCVANPRYSPSCAGFNDANMWYTGDLTSIYGTSFAINQALGFGNTGVRVHSATWGYDYSIGGRYCSGWSLLGICFGWTDSQVNGNMTVYGSNGQPIVSDSNSTSGEYVSGSFRREVLLGNTSRDISTLGNASINLSTVGIASATPYLGFNFTPDICNTSPLTSPQCPGYAQALFDQQCSANPLYDSQCPGYAQAYFTQQCTINQLYNPACPGYAAAYLNYQCSINPLYATQCPGYETAYLEQQCSISPLYSTQCSGYTTASTQCSANPLYASYCPSYQTATNGCSASPLYASYCPGYSTASSSCSANPLYASYCPNYQTATTQCSANALYASYCPSYQTALNTCSTNPLSNTLCTGYTAASTACSNNQLTYSYCPSYTTTLAACGSNPQSNTMCPGYSTTSASSGSTSSGGTIGSTVSKTEATASISSDGTVSTTVSKTGDSNVDKAISSPTTTTNTAAAPAAPVQLTAKPSSSTEPAAKVAAAPAKAEEKKEQKEQKQDGPSQTAKAEGGEKKEEKKTAREEIQEKREAAAKAKAVEEGKQLAGKMGDAANFEQQIAVQNVVIQAMGFTPGFDAYGRAMLQDGRGYKPFEIYRGQRNIDNPSGRRFMTGSDKLHSDMVEQQYQLSK